MTRREEIVRDTEGLAAAVGRNDEKAGMLHALSLLQGFLLDVARIADALTERKSNG